MFIVAYIEAPSRCDHNIACGRMIKKLKSNNREDAIKELKIYAIGTPTSIEDGEPDGECYCDDGLHKITLFEISNEFIMPLNRWKRETNKIIDTIQKQIE